MFRVGKLTKKAYYPTIYCKKQYLRSLITNKRKLNTQANKEVKAFGKFTR